MNLTGGILRMRYRDSWEAPRPMTPGQVYAVTIIDLNPNTGEPEGGWTATRVATSTVFTDANRPSHVILPIVPANRTT